MAKVSMQYYYSKYGALLTNSEIDHIVEYASKSSISLRITLGKFYRWKTIPTSVGFNVTVDDYFACVTHPKFNAANSVYQKLFYEYRYSTLDFQTLSELHIARLIKLRGSMYDVDNVATKLGIDIAAAEQLVKTRKQSTAGNIDTFIRKHGEELGRELFARKQRASKSTQENFKIRYGDQWEIRWANFLATRDSSSLEYCIDKLGEEQGRKKFAKLRTEFAKSSNIEYYVEKYGEQQGQLRYADVCDSKRVTIETFIAKHGEEVGRELYAEMVKNKTNTKEDWIEKHSPTSEEIFLQSAKRSSVYRAILKLSDTQEQAIAAYSRYLDTRISPVTISQRSKFVNNATGPVSNISKAIFSSLEQLLGRQLVYGRKRNEHRIFDPTLNKLFFYDCFDPATNTIIEFNGSAYHASPKLTEVQRYHWCTPWGISYADTAARDLQKIQAAESRGYRVVVVWDYECNGKKRTQSTILKLKDTLNENQINQTKT